MGIRKFIVLLIGIWGIVSSVWGGFESRTIFLSPYFIEVCLMSILFLIICPWSVIMPSGASWRPGISIIMFSTLVFPLPIALIVPLPGLLYISFKNKNKFFQTLLTIGHLSIGIFGTRVFFKNFVFLSNNSLYLLFILLISLCIHFLLNRTVAACIIAYKRNTNILEQVWNIRKDLNWGFFNTYTISYIMFLLYYYIGIVGLIPPIMLLVGIYRSAHYFIKAQDLKVVAYRDALTGAENRASWERLNEPGHKLCGTFALLDLNDFKQINDTLGHAKGDQLLRELVFNIQSDPYTTLRLFRYGGDEFILFVPHEMDQQDVIKGRIKQLIFDQELTWKSKGYPVTISSGIVYFDGNSEDLPAHIQKADERMYKNKYKRKKLKSFAVK